MKTITISKTVNQLQITQDRDCYASSPRGWSNLGHFITIETFGSSPDENPELRDIIKETGQEAKDQAEHMEMITERINEETGEKVLAIYPVTKYEHSGVSYKLGTNHGFESSNNGFYIVTDKTQKELGTPKELFEKVIGQELATYSQWVNGDMYQFILLDENGEEAEACGGFYDIEDIRDHLPREWEKENLSDYIV